MFGSFGGLVVLLALLCNQGDAYHYDVAYTEYNLNENKYAIDPLDYWGQWHSSPDNYTSSPTSWRIPFYTLFLDRFVNGDPFNDNINGTAFEHDLDSNQMRHGGDLEGLIDTLDYLQGMGIKVRVNNGPTNDVALISCRPSTSPARPLSTNRGATTSTRPSISLYSTRIMGPSKHGVARSMRSTQEICALCWITHLRQWAT